MVINFLGKNVRRTLSIQTLIWYIFAVFLQIYYKLQRQIKNKTSLFRTVFLNGFPHFTSRRINYNLQVHNNTYTCYTFMELFNNNEDNRKKGNFNNNFNKTKIKRLV